MTSRGPPVTGRGGSGTRSALPTLAAVPSAPPPPPADPAHQRLQRYLAHRRPFEVAAWVLACCTQIAANTTTTWLDVRRNQLDYRWWEVASWELSSNGVWLALVPLILAALARWPLHWGLLRRNLPRHVAASLAVSVLHVLAMVAIRKAIYASQGARYDFGNWWVEWPYEALKDVRTYALVVAIAAGYRLLLWRLQGEASLLQPPDEPAALDPAPPPAAEAPERAFVARRENGGAWRSISYAQMLQRARAVGQALLDLGLSVERPLAILSGNDLEHLTLAMGALWAGVPYVPVSTAYSLVSQDYGKLRHILGNVTPGLVFASGPEYAKAIATVVAPDVPVVLTRGAVEGRTMIAFDSLLATAPGATLDAAHAQVGPDTIAKFLFTSGSTKQPKGVITTHRMMCANQQMLRQCLGFLADEPPVLVDWLPWNHVFGGSHNVGLTLYNGGTLYIDDGKPTPAGIQETLRNLREISPTIYFNVPKGLEEIASAMDSDPQLRDTLFKRCKAFMFAGAALAQAVWDKLHAHAEASVGERVRVITGLGMTETAPSCTFAVGTAVASGHIGLPVPGVEVKLVKDASTGGKTEIRFRGPNVMPGYWRAPEQTRDAFDDEGYYRTGDAVRWVDPAAPERGLFFDGRTAEDFKLSSGTFVSVGPLRAKIIGAGDPLVRQVRIAELDAYLEASVDMFIGEVGVDPRIGDGGRAYRRRVAALIVAGRAWARFERGAVVFKAEVGSQSPAVGQIQGVWVHPELRGRGLGSAGTATVAAAILAGGRIASLYVNDFNTIARAAYARIGFRPVGTFATVLLD